MSVDNEHYIIRIILFSFPVYNKPSEEQRNQDEKQKQYEKKDKKRQKDTVHFHPSLFRKSSRHQIGRLNEMLN